MPDQVCLRRCLCTLLCPRSPTAVQAAGATSRHRAKSITDVQARRTRIPLRVADVLQAFTRKAGCGFLRLKVPPWEQEEVPYSWEDQEVDALVARVQATTVAETERRDRFIRKALGNPKSRAMLLKLDQQYERFLANTELQQLRFNGVSQAQAEMVAAVASIFGLDTSQPGEGSIVIIKTSQSAPTRLLSLASCCPKLLPQRHASPCAVLPVPLFHSAPRPAGYCHAAGA